MKESSSPQVLLWRSIFVKHLGTDLFPRVFVAYGHKHPREKGFYIDVIYKVKLYY